MGQVPVCEQWQLADSHLREMVQCTGLPVKIEDSLKRFCDRQLVSFASQETFMKIDVAPKTA